MYFLRRSFLPQYTFTSLKCISPPLPLWEQCLAENLPPTLTAIAHTVQWFSSSHLLKNNVPRTLVISSDPLCLSQDGWNDSVDKWLPQDHTTNQAQSHLTATWVSVPWPHTVCWTGRGQGEQRALPACSVPRVTSNLPTLSRHSVHVPLGCQSPGARLEFGTHHAGWCMDFWTCLLLVKQTGLTSKTKSRLINNQKSHNSRKTSRSFYLNAFNSINENHPPIPPEGK